MSFRLFEDRFDPKYHEHLFNLLSDPDELCKYAIAPGKTRTYADGKFKKGIQIDFCGLAATTLLGVNIHGEEESPEKKKISEKFHELLSVDSTERLAEKGFYLKIRFIFSYVYSSFAKSLIDAEASLSRPRGKDRQIVYNFDIQSKLSEELIRDSTLYRSQVSSLEKIASIIERNRILVMTRPERNDHTIQVRFSTIAMPFCLMIVNNRAYSDSYLYAQEEGGKGIHNLFYHYPIQVFDVNDPFQSKYYSYLTNHFDYQWNNEVTLLCKDTTGFNDDKDYQGLSKIRRPTELVFAQKEARIKDYMEGHKMPVDEAAIPVWRANLIDKLSVYLGEDVLSAGTSRKEKPEEPSSPKDNGQQETCLTIGKTDDGQFFFHVYVPAQDINIDFKKPKDHLTYQFMLHVAVAVLEGEGPVMHRKHSARPRVLKQILLPMSQAATNGSGEKVLIDMKFILTHLFDANKEYGLRIPARNIKVRSGYKQWASDLKYLTEIGSDKEKLVLDFTD